MGEWMGDLNCFFSPWSIVGVGKSPVCDKHLEDSSTQQPIRKLGCPYTNEGCLPKL